MADGLGRSGLGGCLVANVSCNSAVDVPPVERLGAAGMQEHPARVDSMGTQERLSISSNTCSVPGFTPPFKAQPRVRHSLLLEWLQPCLFRLLGSCSTSCLTSYACSGSGDALKPHFRHCTKKTVAFLGQGAGRWLLIAGVWGHLNSSPAPEFGTRMGGPIHHHWDRLI